MKNHFIYNVVGTDGKSRKQSFNLKKVIRSVWKDDTTLVVLLDDGHEESLPVTVDKKGNPINKRVFMVSEIDLKDQDIDNFFVAIME